MNKVNYPQVILKFARNRGFGQTFLFILSFLLLVSCVSQAQVNVIFDIFPISAQLFQRDNSNKTTVTIKGKIHTEGYSDISVLVKKDKKNYAWHKQKLTYETGESKNASFTLSSNIIAGLFEYDFAVYAIRGNDSVLIKEADKVLCGDNVIIYGQSNALAEDVNELVRFKDEFKFGRTTFMNYVSGDIGWYETQKWNFYLSGLIGLEVQRQLINTYKIPIGIINGAIGNKKIDDLMIRDEKNHENSIYYYGQLLKKANILGLGKTARIFIWRQGENEAFDANFVDSYPEKFDKLRKQILEDYPGIKKIYVMQNNIYWGDNPKAGKLRDFQRKVKDIYPDCEGLATIGTVTFDGLHYKMEGYLQNGEELSRIIARDFMQSSDTLGITSPDIKSAYFSPNNDSLILEFDKFQQMKYPTETIYRDNSNKTALIELKDYIFLDGKAGKVVAGTQINNKIIFKLNGPSNAKLVTYTPDNFVIGIEPLEGIPYIKNSRGLRAYSFKDFPITTPIPIQTVNLSGRWNGSFLKMILLEWSFQTNTSYSIEKSVNTLDNFVSIATQATHQYLDFKVKRGVRYYYRIKVNNASYSNIIEIYVPIQTKSEVVLIDKDMLVFPNPIQKGEDLTINTQFDNPVVELRLNNSTGTLVESIPAISSNYTIKTDKLSTGVYFIEAIFSDKKKLIKKFVIE